MLLPSALQRVSAHCRNSQKIGISRVRHLVAPGWHAAGDVVPSQPSPTLWHKDSSWAAGPGLWLLPTASGMGSSAGKQMSLWTTAFITAWQPATPTAASPLFDYFFFNFSFWQSPHVSKDKNLIFSKTSGTAFPLKLAFSSGTTYSSAGRLGSSSEFWP